MYERPEDIPQDVWDRSIGYAGGEFAYPEVTLAIARAIMEERERCGKYATDQAEREPYGHCKATAYLIAYNIMGGP